MTLKRIVSRDKLDVANLRDGEAAVRKEFVAEIDVKAIDAEARTVKFKITSGDVDRDNDIIDPQGWELDDFMMSPVVLWAHDHKQPPIARALEVSSVPNGLVSVAQFPEAGIYPFADMVFNLIRGGFLRACSVGFLPVEWSYDEERRGINFKRQSLLEWSVCPVPANPHALVAASKAGVDLEPLRKWVGDTIAAWPGDLKLSGRAWDKLQTGGAELHGVEVETLLQAVRAIGERLDPEQRSINGIAECGYTSVQAGATSPDHVHDYGLYADEAGVVRGWCCQVADHSHRITAESFGRGETESSDGHTHKLMRVGQLASLLADSQRLMDLRSPQVTRDQDKGVVPRDISSETSDRGSSWAAPRLSDFTDQAWADLGTVARRRIARHFAWAAEMPPAAFGDLKLPHHRASDGAVVFRGVASAAGRLAQASIPDDDMAAVRTHLGRHYRQFDMTPPWERAADGWEKAVSAVAGGDDLAVALRAHGFADEADAVSAGADAEQADVAAGESDDVVFFTIDEPDEQADEEDTFAVDIDDLKASLGDVVMQAMRQMAQDETRKSLNEIRGRLD